MDKSLLRPSDSTNTIEASIEMVKKKRRRKRRCPAAKPISPPKSDRMSLRSAASLKSMVSISKSSCVKILSAPEISQNRRTTLVASTIGDNAPKKYSSLLFSANSLASMPETQKFNRPLDIDSLVSEAVLGNTFLSEYEKRLNDSQMNLQTDVDVEKEWEDLSQQISPRHNSRQHSQQHISQMEIEYQSEVTFNQVFHSPTHESYFELAPSDFHHTRTGNQSYVNEAASFRDSVNERIATQDLSLSLLTKQNQKISTQLQGLECYVREKMEAAEDYVKTKLTQIIDATYAVEKALNDLKRVESDDVNRMQLDNEPSRKQRVIEPVRIARDKQVIQTRQVEEVIPPQPVREVIPPQPVREVIPPQPVREVIPPQPVREVIPPQPVREVIPPQPVKQLRSTSELAMPTIPISRDFSLVILNIALKSADYMEQFVSEASRIVTLNAYNCRNSVRSIMTELFSINLLRKYRWSVRTPSSVNKPTFSSLANILRAMARLLINYMSEHDVRREVKAFFKEIYCGQRTKTLCF